MAEYSTAAEDDIVMTDLEEREVYNTVDLDGSPRITLPSEVWASVINCKYTLVSIHLYIIMCVIDMTPLSLL